MINLAQVQTLDYAAFGAAMVGLLGTIIGMIVWMVKLSAKRSQEMTDRFIKHLEDAALTRAREDAERAAVKVKEDTERATERAQFLDAINQNTQVMSRMADNQKEVAERLSDVVTKVSELALTVARIEEQQERFSREST